MEAGASGATEGIFKLVWTQTKEDFNWTVGKRSAEVAGLNMDIVR